MNKLDLQIGTNVKNRELEFKVLMQTSCIRLHSIIDTNYVQFSDMGIIKFDKPTKNQEYGYEQFLFANNMYIQPPNHVHSKFRIHSSIGSVEVNTLKFGFFDSIYQSNQLINIDVSPYMLLGIDSVEVNMFIFGSLNFSVQPIGQNRCMTFGNPFN